MAAATEITAMAQMGMPSVGVLGAGNVAVSVLPELVYREHE